MCTTGSGSAPPSRRRVVTWSWRASCTCPQPSAPPAAAAGPERCGSGAPEREHLHPTRRSYRAQVENVVRRSGRSSRRLPALVEVSRSDIRYVQEAASEALAIAVPAPHPAELNFGTVVDSDVPVTKSIRLAGPPLAVAVTVSQSEAWLTLSVKPPEVQVLLDTTTSGFLAGTVTLTGPTGHVVIPVSAQIETATAAIAPTAPFATRTGTHTGCERRRGASPPSRLMSLSASKRLRPRRAQRGSPPCAQAPAPATPSAPLPTAQAVLEAQRHHRPRLGHAHAAVHRPEAAVGHRDLRQRPDQGDLSALPRPDRPCCGRSGSQCPLACPGSRRGHRRIDGWSGGRLRHGQDSRQVRDLGSERRLLGRFLRPRHPHCGGRLRRSRGTARARSGVRRTVALGLGVRVASWFSRSLAR